MSLWHQNDVAMLIWHHNDVIAPWVRWDVVKGAWNRLKGASEWLSDFNADSGRWICQIPPISQSLWLPAWLPMPVLPLMFESEFELMFEFEFEFNPFGWLSSKGTWVWKSPEQQRITTCLQHPSCLGLWNYTAWSRITSSCTPLNVNINPLTTRYPEDLLSSVNILRLKQDGWNFTDNIFERIFLNENIWIL